MYTFKPGFLRASHIHVCFMNKIMFKKQQAVIKYICTNRAERERQREIERESF